jgi:hypothetical protein
MKLNGYGFILVLLLSALVQAGGMNSGGGTGYIAADGSVHLLDIYEAHHYNLQLDLGTPGTSVVSRMNQIINKLLAIMPARAKDYQNFFSSFDSEVEWIGPSEEIENPSDLSGVIVPSGAKIVQLAFQHSDAELAPGRKRYVIDKKLFDNMTGDDQVALIMHELVYHDQLSDGLDSSEAARYVTENILSISFNWHSYVQLMGAKYFGRNEFLGVYDDPTNTDYINRIEYAPESQYNNKPNCLTYNYPVSLQGFFADDISKISYLQKLGYIDKSFSNLQSGVVWASTDPYCNSPQLINNNELVSGSTLSMDLEQNWKIVASIEPTSVGPTELPSLYVSSHGKDFRRRDNLYPTEKNNDGVLLDFFYSHMTVSDLNNNLIFKSAGILSPGAPGRYTEKYMVDDNKQSILTVDLKDCSLAFANRTGFLLGNVTLQADQYNSQWTITKIKIVTPSTILSAPQVGDIIPY